MPLVLTVKVGVGDASFEAAETNFHDEFIFGGKPHKHKAVNSDEKSSNPPVLQQLSDNLLNLY